MVTLTDDARLKLRSLLDDEADPAAGLRVEVVPGGCSGFEYDLSLAGPQEGDEVVESDGVGHRGPLQRPVPARRRARLRGGLPGRRVPHPEPQRDGLLRLRQSFQA